MGAWRGGGEETERVPLPNPRIRKVLASRTAIAKGIVTLSSNTTPTNDRPLFGDDGDEMPRSVFQRTAKKLYLVP